MKVLNKALMLGALSAMSLTLVAGQASAHVVYGTTLNEDPTQTRQVGSNAGWLGGQNAATGTDSHINRFMGFELTERSTVNFTINAVSGFSYTPHGATSPVIALDDLNPGYSLFSGLAPHLSHDGVFYAGQTPYATWSPFADSDVGSSPTSTKWGAYRSNDDFTLANASGPATLDYIHGAGNSTGNSISGQYVLEAGLYSLVVGGADQDNLNSLFGNMVASNACNVAGAACDAYREDRFGRGFNIEFSTTSTPLPVPAAVYLFGTGLAGLAGLARRKMKANV